MVGFFFSEMIFFEGYHETAASSDFALGTFAGLGFIAIAMLCWYKGVCKPLTGAEDDEEEKTEQPDDEQYSARNLDD